MLHLGHLSGRGVVLTLSEEVQARSNPQLGGSLGLSALARP